MKKYNAYKVCIFAGSFLEAEKHIKAALSLRKVFARVYLLFGDFRGLQ
jgi:hypothetical protein